MIPSATAPLHVTNNFASVLAVALASAEDRQAKYGREQSCTTNAVDTTTTRYYYYCHYHYTTTTTTVTTPCRAVLYYGCCRCYNYYPVLLLLPLPLLLPPQPPPPPLHPAEQSCSTDEAQTVVKKTSKLHCAAACNKQRDCQDYNFDDSSKHCSLYRHKTLQ